MNAPEPRRVRRLDRGEPAPAGGGVRAAEAATRAARPTEDAGEQRGALPRPSSRPRRASTGWPSASAFPPSSATCCCSRPASRWMPSSPPLCAAAAGGAQRPCHLRPRPCRPARSRIGARSPRAAPAPLAPPRAGGRAALVAARLRIDERVLHYLAGVNQLDQRLAPLLRRIGEPAGDGRRACRPRSIRSLATRSTRAGRRCRCCSSGAATCMASATSRPRLAGRCGLQLHVLRADDIPAGPQRCELAGLALGARGRAAPTARCWSNAPTPRPAAAARRFAGAGGRLDPRRPCASPRASPATTCASRWRSPTAATSCASGSRPWAVRRRRLGSALDSCRPEFRLSARDIQRASAALARAAAVRPDPAALTTALWQACRDQARPRLDDLAQRIEPARRLGRPRPARGAERRSCARSPIHVRHR